MRLARATRRVSFDSLRIPIRGYEGEGSMYRADNGGVTNPYKGL